MKEEKNRKSSSLHSTPRNLIAEKTLLEGRERVDDGRLDSSPGRGHSFEPHPIRYLRLRRSFSGILITLQSQITTNMHIHTCPCPCPCISFLSESPKAQSHQSQIEISYGKIWLVLQNRPLDGSCQFLELLIQSLKQLFHTLESPCPNYWARYPTNFFLLLFPLFLLVSMLLFFS